MATPSRLELLDSPSILDPFSPEDHVPIRKIQTHIYSLLHPPQHNFVPPSLPQLSLTESVVLSKITAHLFPTQFNPLFTTLCTKFASAHKSSDEMASKAALHFDLLATEKVWMVEVRNRREYEITRKLVQGMVESGEMNYEDGGSIEKFNAGDPADGFGEANGGVEEQGGVSGVEFIVDASYGSGAFTNDGEDDSFSGMDMVGGSDDQEWLQQEENFVVESPQKKGHPGFQHIVDVYGFGYSKPNMLSSQSYDDDENSEDDEAFMSESFKTFQEKREKGRKHKAIRGRGERLIQTSTHDRKPAACNGIPQPSKLRAIFQTEKPDPNNPGEMLPGKPAEYVYPNAVDWASKTSVAKLNNWRSQMFRRALGPKRLARSKWTVQEHDYFLHILTKHIESSEVRGRYGKINWEFIAGKFNRKWEGHVFKKGELLASGVVKPKKGQEGQLARMRDDSVCSARSYMSMQNQLAHFTSERAKAILKATKAADEVDRLRGLGLMSTEKIVAKPGSAWYAATGVESKIDPLLMLSPTLEDGPLTIGSPPRSLGGHYQAASDETVHLRKYEIPTVDLKASVNAGINPNIPSGMKTRPKAAVAVSIVDNKPGAGKKRKTIADERPRAKKPRSFAAKSSEASPAIIVADFVTNPALKQPVITKGLNLVKITPIATVEEPKMMKLSSVMHSSPHTQQFNTAQGPKNVEWEVKPNIRPTPKIDPRLLVDDADVVEEEKSDELQQNAHVFIEMRRDKWKLPVG